MKKLISSLLVLATAVCMLSGCGRKDLMEAPAYPLEKAVIEEQLAAQKLEWTVEEAAADTENQTRYVLYNNEGKRIADLVSEGKGESRYLKVSFLSTLREEDKEGAVIPTEEWVGIIAASTVWFGGFEDQYEPYKEFTNGGKSGRAGRTRTYIREDMTDEADKIYDEIIKWTGEYEGVTCIYKMGQPEKTEEMGLDKPKQELVSVTYYNDAAYAEGAEEKK